MEIYFTTWITGSEIAVIRKVKNQIFIRSCQPVVKCAGTDLTVTVMVTVLCFGPTKIIIDYNIDKEIAKRSNIDILCNIISEFCFKMTYKVVDAILVVDMDYTFDELVRKFF